MIPPGTEPAREIAIDRLVLEIPGFTASDAPALAAALAERLAGAGRAGDYARIDIALSAAPAGNAALAEQIAAALMQRFA